MSITEKTPLLSEREQLRNKKSGKKCLIWIIICVLIAIIAAETWYMLKEANGKAALQQLLKNSYPLPSYMKKSIKGNSNMIEELNDAVLQGKDKLFSMLEMHNNTLKINDASYKHQHSISNTEEGVRISRLGFIENEVTKVLKSHGYNETINYKDLTDLQWTLETHCVTSNIECNRTKYRSITGLCNNIDNPSSWGVSMNPFRRSLPASYKDGVLEPRGGFLSTDLPNSRLVSSDVHRAVYKSDDRLTVMLATYGQFIDHDITATALTRSANEDAISCCSGENHPECFPVILPENDEYYRTRNVSCMEFVRSAPALVCSFGEREQLNQASSYIDGSVVYGSTDDLTNKLRSFKSGQLKMTYTETGRELLPFSEDANDACNQEEEMKKGRYCFMTGDNRANENTYLTSMHLIFARHHNSLASQLSILNPEWNDEIIFEEVRRILSAQLQHITYNEFLPPLLGVEIMEKLQLNSLEDGYWTGYNKSVDSSISNSFATAAFRFAHSLIPGMMKMASGNAESFIELRKMLFNPYPLYEDGQLEKLLISAFETPVQRADSFFTSQLTQHLFESSNGTEKSCGLDLVALNIQRGRDHGLPGFVQWREYCGFEKVESFDQLKPYMDRGSLQVISTLYENVNDVDLYTGAVSEIPVEGGMLGPTFTCLIADQFYRLKKGDRFWYETNEKPQAFTEYQLSEIRNSSLGSILCSNSDNLQQIKKNVMKSIQKDNERINCNDSVQLDLTKWIEPSELKIKTKLTKLTLSNVVIYEESNVLPLPNITGVLWSGRITINKTVIEIVGTYEFGEFEAVFENKEEVKISKNTSLIDIYSVFYIQNKLSAKSNNSLNVPIIFHTNVTSDNTLIWNGDCTVILNDVFEIDEKEENTTKVETHQNNTSNEEPHLVNHSDTTNPAHEIEHDFHPVNSTEIYETHSEGSKTESHIGNFTKSTDAPTSETERHIDNVTRTTEAPTVHEPKTERPVTNLSNSTDDPTTHATETTESHIYKSTNTLPRNVSEIYQRKVTKREAYPNNTTETVPYSFISTTTEIYTGNDIIKEPREINVKNSDRYDVNYSSNEVSSDEKEKRKIWKFGKYMIKVSSGKLSVHLKDENTLEWWNGVLPEIIELPVKDNQSVQYKIEWSFETVNKLEGNATFHTYNVRNELEFLGYFIFSMLNNWNEDNTFDNFLTTNTTFFSPIYYQSNSINISPASRNVKSEDVFCPVVLLGNLSDDKSKFFWNKKVLVTFMNL